MKKYKKGETVYLNWSISRAGMNEQDIYILEKDMTEKELEEIAESLFWEDYAPEWWVSEYDE